MAPAAYAPAAYALCRALWCPPPPFSLVRFCQILSRTRALKATRALHVSYLTSTLITKCSAHHLARLLVLAWYRAWLGWGYPAKIKHPVFRLLCRALYLHLGPRAPPLSLLNLPLLPGCRFGAQLALCQVRCGPFFKPSQH